MNNDDIVNANSSLSRFSGVYRAVVVETNDPLQMRRVRFRCPELHDSDMKPEECPWASISNEMGGPRSGSWHSPVIGDHVLISFEKSHAYGPVVVGYWQPTRFKQYPLPGLYGPSPRPLDVDGELSEAPDEASDDYYPKDNRPMSSGRMDRYGNLDLMSSVGFVPSTHKKPPVAPDYDALQKSEFESSITSAVSNDPDVKMMLRMSKYGHVALLGDQGYDWASEFSGDHKEDDEFEIERWRHQLKLLCEDKPSEHDQRRIMLMTRYGHKFEMRDVGWAQSGPVSSKSRSADYGDPKTLSNETELDQRWVKLRTKGGMLIQLSDRGTHPNDDEYVKRALLDEVGGKADGEDDHWSGDRDARWMRFCTRHGYKIVLDDRGSDPKDATGKETPYGNGVLIKGRRSPGSGDAAPEGDPKGFYWEFNENVGTNQTTWGTPSGRAIQLNDRHQYIMLSTGSPDYTKPWRGLEENEFLDKPMVMDDIEPNSSHIKIDHANEYLSIRTRSGRGAPPQDGVEGPINPVELDGLVNQGLEIRDGSKGDGAWIELTDANERGMWIWGKGKYVICRASRQPEPSNLMWWLDENNKEIVIRHNDDSGKIQIFCSQQVEIFGGSDVNISAANKLSLSAGGSIDMGVGSTKFSLNSSGLGFNGKMSGTRIASYFEGVDPGPGAGASQNPLINVLPTPSPSTEPQLVPTDRGKRYNEDLMVPIDIEEIEHTT